MKIFKGPVFIKEADLNKNNFDYNNEEEFWNRVEFEKPTEKWFNPGPLGYGISTGTLQLGTEVSIQLTPDEEMNIDHPLEIRAQLTSRDENWNLIKVIKSNTVYLSKNEIYTVITVNLSETQGEYYLLTAEVMGEKGEILDTLLAKINVPLQEVSAELNIDRKVYGPRDTVRFQVTTHGPTMLTFGRPFAVETLINGIWTELPLGLMFTLDLIMLEPGDTFEQTLNLQDFKEHFKEGSYRITKQVSGQGTDIQRELSVEFKIKK